MDFRYGEKAEKLRKEVREFVKENIPVEGFSGLLSDEHFDEDWAFSMKMSKKLSEIGWLTMKWPKEYGGMDASPWETCVLKEEAGYWGIPGLTMGASGTQWVGPSLMFFGTEEQKKKYLPQIASGEADGVWCTGYSEPDAGSDFASLQTRAERQGDVYVINGQKVWNSVGHRAKWCWLACRTDPNAKRKHDGISLFIVDMESEGVKVQPIPNVVGAEVFNEIIFIDVKVPVENRVGKENEGWSILMQALAFERGVVIITGSMLKRYLDELLVYAKETGAIKRPEIRKQLVDLAIEYRTLRVLALEEIWKEAKGDMVIHEPARNKAYNVDVFEKVALFGTQLIGAYSQVDPLIKENKYKRVNGLLEWLYWMLPGTWNGGGTQDIMRNIVAQFALGLPNR